MAVRLDLRTALRRIADRVADDELSRVWPAPRWQGDPVGFARTILGVELWQFQIDLLNAIAGGARHIAVAGGRKIGKDFVVAVAALWWYSVWPDARVVLLAPTGKQLDGIAYREIRMLFSGSGRCVDCKRSDPDGPRPCPHSAILTGAVSLLARTGIKSEDFREIVGQTAIGAGGLRGTSGARILAIEDEASDIKDEFDEALVGNLAGQDCVRVLISNPTRTQGFFFRAFHDERHLYKTFQISTLDNPNVKLGRTVYRGLGDAQWIAERETAWGRGSPAWAANVEGKFVKAEAGQLFTIEAISEAERRWDEMDTPDGRLTIGVDVAGEGHDGDETAFAIRRGKKVLEVVAERGLSPDAILVRIRDYLRKHGTREDTGEDKPTVVLDRDGQTGARVHDTVNAYRLRDEHTEAEFKLIGFRGSPPPAGRMGEIYRLMRDALYGGLVDAFREGLAIPSDVKLEGELLSLRWRDSERGKSQLIMKSELRDILGRSPDRMDALALCTHAGRAVAPSTVAGALPPVRGGGLHRPEESRAIGLDPYAAMGAWGRRR